MPSRRSRLTVEGLERLVHELVGVEPSSEELERLRKRLQSLREELDVLEQWLDPASEPLPRVRIEAEDER